VRDSRQAVWRPLQMLNFKVQLGAPRVASDSAAAQPQEEAAPLERVVEVVRSPGPPPVSDEEVAQRLGLNEAAALTAPLARSGAPAGRLGHLDTLFRALTVRSQCCCKLLLVARRGSARQGGCALQSSHRRGLLRSARRRAARHAPRG
jgi:hypothetical protein